MDLSVSLLLVSLGLLMTHLSSVSLKTLFLLGHGTGILILTSRVLMPMIVFCLVMIEDGGGVETLHPMAFNKCY